MESTARKVLIYETNFRLTQESGAWSGSFTAPLDPADRVELALLFQNRAAQPPRFVWTLVPATGDENPALARPGYPTEPHFEWRAEALLHRQLATSRGNYERVRPADLGEPVQTGLAPGVVASIPTSTVLESGAPAPAWFRVPMRGAGRLFYSGNALMYEFVPAPIVYELDLSALKAADAVRVHVRIPVQHGAPQVERPYNGLIARLFVR